MTTDLTYSKNQRKEPLKDMVLPDGTRRKVPFHFWRVDVFTNPLGETAQLAARNKDPDLDKIKVDQIPLKMFLEVPVIDIVKPAEPVRPPIVNDNPAYTANLKIETAKKMGFRTAEEGKTGR